MKKKILVSVLMLFCLTIFTGNVNAENLTTNFASHTTKNQIPFFVKSQAPSVIPNDGDTVSVAISEIFDFSRVEFSKPDGTEGTVYGHGDMRKFIFSKDVIPTAESNNPADLFGENWFVGYCLDESKNWPILALYNNTNFILGNLSLGVLKQKLAAGTITQEQFNQALTASAPAIVQDFVSIGLIYSGKNKYDPEYPAIVSVDYELQDGETDVSVITKLTSTETADKIKLFKFKINSVTYSKLGDAESTKDVSYGGEIVGIQTVNPSLMTKPKGNILYDRYTATSSVDKKYESALWILEHSYPTLGLEETLRAAGVDIDNLKNEIKTLQKKDSNDDKYGAVIPPLTQPLVASQTRADVTDSEMEELIEGYVYSTIQYAVWYVTETAETRIAGDTIKNSTELNKLYQYLIKSGDHTGYGSLDTISDKVLFTGDTEKYTKTDDGYKFGPFKASYKALDDTPVINVSLKTSEEGVKITDADGKVIDHVANGGEFYIQVGSKAKVGNVTVNLKTDDVKTFYPKTNRARIYNPEYGAYQNAITGGKIQDTKLENSFDIIVNAKTGVEDVAILLMITLIAFSLGYLVLSYKNKPVELN